VKNDDEATAQQRGAVGDKAVGPIAVFNKFDCTWTINKSK
jgi:hypothetical protein